MNSDDSLLSTVAQDLKYLRSNWDQSVEEVSIRVLSPILRLLLVQGDLQKAWNRLGFDKSPRIAAYVLPANILADKGKTMDFASTGGALQDGVRLVGFTATNTEQPKAAKGPKKAAPQIESHWLPHFLGSPCLVIQGRSIPRRVLIHYVANKLGGDHYDSKRDDSAEGQLFQLLDYAHAKYGIRRGIIRKSIIYYELLTIGQALVHSEDINKFCDEVKNIYGF